MTLLFFGIRQGRHLQKNIKHFIQQVFIKVDANVISQEFIKFDKELVMLHLQKVLYTLGMH